MDGKERNGGFGLDRCTRRALDFVLGGGGWPYLLTGLRFRPTLRYMADAKKKKKTRRKALMVGLGLDSDGHKRLTTGPNFVLMGGSQETHDEMTEKAIKINEKLAAAGKRLEEVSHEEFDDIAHSVGLPPGLPPHKPGNGKN